MNRESRFGTAALLQDGIQRADANGHMQEAVREVDILILGAGLSGTSLAARLEKLGFAGSIVLLESRAHCEEEARWCFWGGAGLDDGGCLKDDFASLVGRSWSQWQVCDARRCSTSQAQDVRYQEIWSPSFFRHFHERWDESGAVQLWRGTRVLSLQEDAQGVTVVSTRGTWRAAQVFDARHQGSPALNGGETAGHIHLVQDFVGWVIEAPRPVFEPERATLMDFRLVGPQSEAVHFAYVLPQTTTRALVESTHFGRTPLSLIEHEAFLKRYLTQQYGTGPFSIVARESGALPMTTAPLQERISPRVCRIGIAGGAARPSSGYAFGRVARQTERLAREVVGLPCSTAPLVSRLRAWKYAALDEVFLDVLCESPALGVRCFIALFSQVEPLSLVRFLSERSSLKDELRIIGALPKIPFCRAALRRLLAHLGRKQERQIDWEQKRAHADALVSPETRYAG